MVVTGGEMERARRSGAHRSRARGVASAAALVLVALATCVAPAQGAASLAPPAGCLGPDAVLQVAWNHDSTSATATAACIGNPDISRAILGSTVTTCSGQVVVGG